jgi:hypothetical protein
MSTVTFDMGGAAFAGQPSSGSGWPRTMSAAGAGGFAVPPEPAQIFLLVFRWLEGQTG